MQSIVFACVKVCVYTCCMCWPSTRVSRYLSNSSSFFTASSEILGAPGKHTNTTLILSLLPCRIEDRQRQNKERVKCNLCSILWYILYVFCTRKSHKNGLKRNIGDVLVNSYAVIMFLILALNKFRAFPVNIKLRQPASSQTGEKTTEITSIEG